MSGVVDPSLEGSCSRLFTNIFTWLSIVAFRFSSKVNLGKLNVGGKQIGQNHQLTSFKAHKETFFASKMILTPVFCNLSALLFTKLVNY